MTPFDLDHCSLCDVLIEYMDVTHAYHIHHTHLSIIHVYGGTVCILSTTDLCVYVCVRVFDQF